jgi:hypothetical protein
MGKRSTRSQRRELLACCSRWGAGPSSPCRSRATRRPLEQVLDHAPHLSRERRFEKDGSCWGCSNATYGRDGLVRMPAPERYSSVVSWLLRFEQAWVAWPLLP